LFVTSDVKAKVAGKQEEEDQWDRKMEARSWQLHKTPLSRAEAHEPLREQLDGVS
jgi:hypothetical protein